MRFGAAISLLCAVAAVAPAALAMPVVSDATDGLEARAYDAEVADLIARSDFDEATSLLARAVEDVLSARTDPPRYHKNDPENGKKPKYSQKDPNPPPKYRQKDPHKPNREPKPKPGPSRRTRELGEVEDFVLAARTDPPHYHKNDPNNGKKPKYSEKDPNPPPKYRQKDPYKPNREPKPKPGPSRRTRELAEVDDLWAREVDEDLWARDELEEMWARDVEVVMARNRDPPRYHKDDPLKGPKPKYSVKDPNPPPKYREKDPYPKPKQGSSRRPREFADFW